MAKKEALSEEDWTDVFGAAYADEETDELDAEDTEEVEAQELVESEDGAEAEEVDSDEDEDEDESEDVSDEETADSDGEEDPTEEPEENATDDDAKTAAAEVLERIRAVDPSIQTFNDLEDVGLFAVLIDRGIEPEEALRISSPKLRSKSVEQTKAASKKHMKATAASGRDDAIDMDAIKMFRAARPGISEKEAIALYRRVNGK